MIRLRAAIFLILFPVTMACVATILGLLFVIGVATLAGLCLLALLYMLLTNERIDVCG